MYSTLNIKCEDKQQQVAQWAANYRASDAPVMLLFYMDGSLATGSCIDCGIAPGYEDTNATANSYRAARAPIENWVRCVS